MIQGEEKIDSLSLWELWLSLIAKSHMVLEGLLQHLSTTTIFSPLPLWNKRPFLLGKAGTYTLTSNSDSQRQVYSSQTLREMTMVTLYEVKQ